MTPRLKYLSATAGVLLLAAPAFAQTTMPPAQSGPGQSGPGMSGPNMQDQRRMPAPAPARPRTERPNESLGQAPNSGVIHPPDTGDSGVIAPRNRSNTPMPEVRPPGTPGGNPNVEPK